MRGVDAPRITAKLRRPEGVQKLLSRGVAQFFYRALAGKLLEDLRRHALIAGIEIVRHAMYLARQVEHRGEDRAVYARAVAGQRHRTHALLVKDLAEARRVQTDQACKTQIEQIHLALAQHPHQEAGPELAALRHLLDQAIGTVA